MFCCSVIRLCRSQKTRKLISQRASAQLVAAVHHCHHWKGSGLFLVHRDIKSENDECVEKGVVSSSHWSTWNQHGLIREMGSGKQSCRRFLCGVSFLDKYLNPSQAWGLWACISPACQSEGEIPILRSESNMNRKSGTLKCSKWSWSDFGRENIFSRVKTRWSYRSTLTLAPSSRWPDSRVSCASEWID